MTLSTPCRETTGMVPIQSSHNVAGTVSDSFLQYLIGVLQKLLVANTIIRHTSQLKNLPYSELSNSPKVTW